MKRVTFLLALVLFFCSISIHGEANVLRRILRAYETYQEVNMALWLVGDINAEKRLGKELQFWMGLMYKEEKDPATVKYVTDIFNRLLPHFRTRGLNYDIRVIRNNVPNAFVIPGGHVYVFTGLLDMVQSDDELATVIAHELAHAERRHSLKNFRASTAAVAILNKAVKNRRDRETWGALLGYLTLMRFSRNQEREADEIGHFRMAEAGFNPAAQVTLWEKFYKLSSGDTPKIFQYLSTHPPSTERIENARRNLEKMGVAERRVFSDTRRMLSAEYVNLLENPGFEQEPTRRNPLPSWEVIDGTARISNQVAIQGRRSLELDSENRVQLTRVVSEYIKADRNSDFNFSGYVRTKDGAQNIAVGVEIFDSNKRLRDRAWLIESTAIESQWKKIEARLTNKDGNEIFPHDTSYIRLLLQNGLMSTGKAWFDNLRLRPADVKDPINLIKDGQFLYANSDGSPKWASSENGRLKIALDTYHSNYSSLKISPKTDTETIVQFEPISYKEIEAKKTLTASFYYKSESQFSGTIIIAMKDKNNNVLSRRLAQAEFETDPGEWAGTSFIFENRLNEDEKKRISSIVVKVAANIPQGSNLWLDNFVMR